ncbi:MAG: hypothetical protein R6V61_13355 [Wenzhouxiangellaceae bacterium]
MTKATNSFAVLAAAAAFVFSASAQSQSSLALVFDGLEIVPKGQVEHFSYDPSTRTTDIQTFFGDIRCDPATETTDEVSTLNLDKFSDLEIDAEYAIDSSGSIIYDLEKRTIEIVTDSGIAKPACQHVISAVGDIIGENGAEPEPGTFWLSSFDSPLRVSASAPDTVATGDTLSVELAVENTSQVLVATDILVGLDLPDLSGLGIPEPTLCGTDEAVVNWSVLMLWPDDLPDTICLEYDIPADAALDGEQIEIRVTNVEASDRSRRSPLPVQDPNLTVVTAITGS